MIPRFPTTALVLGTLMFSLLITGSILSLLSQKPMASAAGDWREDWAVKEEFEIVVDADGFVLPTAIAFIPSPGGDPKDPLYFVTELRGALKVVTNDGTVFTFADDFFTLNPSDDIAVIGQEIGMAGICLAPSDGYVFVTFSYQVAGGGFRNNIVRFQSVPDTFSLKPTSQLEFTDVFERSHSVPSHQIGACQVSGDRLYVNVAEAGQVAQSQQPDSLLGKILKMTLEGNPASDNPYYQDSNRQNARNYVWAMGLRNPFGLKVVGNQLFVADNGPTIDRFLHVSKGGNYLWDGTNMSMATNAKALFIPGRGVAQLDHQAADANLFPTKHGESFFLTMTSNPIVHRPGFPAIWEVPFDISRDLLTAPPQILLRYRGEEVQVMSALALGPDGLYFAPLLPRPGAESSKVLKIRYAPSISHPYILGAESNPNSLMHQLGCITCHTWADNPGGTVGPNLSQEELVPRLIGRLSSSKYSLSVEQLDKLDEEPFRSYRDARRSVAEAVDLEKIRLWLYYRLLEPRFDDPGAAMPKLGLTDRQASLIADHLSGSINNGLSSKISGVARDIKNLFPRPTRANANQLGAAIFVVGIGAGTLATILIWLAVGKWRKRRRSVDS